MSATDSNLSSPKYGYDFVVSATQSSINATMKAYLSAGSVPETIVCHVADANGNPIPVDHQTLLASANGSDPFSVLANGVLGG